MDAKLASLQRLQQIVETLRGPDGCPWDRQQTLRSLRRNFLEEACEIVDAIETGSCDDIRENNHGVATATLPLHDNPEVCEELGDLLMNIFLAARVAEEAGGFNLESVVTRICDKLVYRHPHVFGSEKIDDVDGVLSRWEALKQTEKKDRAKEGNPNKDNAQISRLDKVPRSLPPLSAAHELTRLAAKIGFDWRQARDVLDKVREEIDEVETCLDSFDGSETETDKLRGELGDLLFAVVNVARKVDISPEEALRSTNRKFYRRFRFVEKHVDDHAVNGRTLTLEEMEELWQEAKRQESSPQ